MNGMMGTWGGMYGPLGIPGYSNGMSMPPFGMNGMGFLPGMSPYGQLGPMGCFPGMTNPYGMGLFGNNPYAMMNPLAGIGQGLNYGLNSMLFNMNNGINGLMNGLNGMMNPFASMNPHMQGQFNPYMQGQFNPMNPYAQGQFNPYMQGQFNPYMQGQFRIQ